MCQIYLCQYWFLVVFYSYCWLKIKGGIEWHVSLPSGKISSSFRNFLYWCTFVQQYICGGTFSSSDAIIALLVIMLHNHVCIVPFTKYFWNTETLTLEVITRHYKIQVTIDHLYTWRCQLICTYYDSACWTTSMSNKCGVFCTISVWLKRRIAWGENIQVIGNDNFGYTTHFQLLTKHSLSDFKTSPNTCMNLWLPLYLQIWT